MEQTQGESGGFGLTALLAAFLAALLAALLTAFLVAQPKDFAVGDAAGEVVDGDATHGADLGNGAAAKA